VIDKYFLKNACEIEVINFGTRNGHGDETIEKLLRLENQSLAIRISRFDGEQDELKLQNSSVLLFDSPENFKASQSRINFQPGQLHRLHHLVYIHDATIEDLQIQFSEKHMIDNIDFLVNETRNSIEIATAFMFSFVACWKNQFKVVNRFTRQQNRWENSKFFVEKFSNFYNCPLKTNVAFPDFPQFVRALNYAGNNSRNHDNQSIMFFQGPLDFSLMNQSNSYVSSIDLLNICSPPGEVYGDYEKMFLPFDSLTWIAVAVTVIVGTTGILVIKMTAPEIQRVFFGSNNRSPLMNFIDVLLNGGQNTNLIENAPRVFLMTFIFWSLIFR
jgi:hypothetical protein